MFYTADWKQIQYDTAGDIFKIILNESDFTKQNFIKYILNLHKFDWESTVDPFYLF